ncbi:MAG: DUF2304 domain-containing protein [Clostridia bacterium]|nr:DUF2304 domain-containing protein [Clostridia bacterium]
MNIYLRITLIIAVIIYFVLIVCLLKKRRLELKYTLLWLFGGVVMVLILIFPDVFMLLMRKIGIVDATNGLFAALSFIIIIILMSITSIVSKLNASLRGLTQKCAIYEKRIRELEDKLK